MGIWKSKSKFTRDFVIIILYSNLFTIAKYLSQEIISALSLLLKQVFLQYKISNCQNNHTISQDMCTLFARSLYPTLCSWIIRVDICHPLYPPKDNPWLKLPLIRSKMLLPFGHKQYFEADKQQNSNVSQSYFFSHKPTSEISDFSQSHTVGDTAGRSSLETKWRNCFFFFRV